MLLMVFLRTCLRDVVLSSGLLVVLFSIHCLSICMFVRLRTHILMSKSSLGRGGETIRLSLWCSLLKDLERRVDIRRLFVLLRVVWEQRYIVEVLTNSCYHLFCCICLSLRLGLLVVRLIELASELGFFVGLLFYSRFGGFHLPV